jgi:hypothetical protein
MILVAMSRCVMPYTVCDVCCSVQRYCALYTVRYLLQCIAVLCPVQSTVYLQYAGVSCCIQSTVSVAMCSCIVLYTEYSICCNVWLYCALYRYGICCNVWLYCVLYRYGICCSVERDRLRERERQARAQMSSQAEREAENLGAPFFGPPVRVCLTPIKLYSLSAKVEN